MSKNLCGVAALAACLGTALAQPIPPGEMRAQTVAYMPPSKFTLRTQVELVEVPVVVRDNRRRAVAGLTREDFELFDNGKKQDIAAFSVQHFTPAENTGGGKNGAVASAAAAPKEATRPRFVALLFDNLNIDDMALKPAKDAALRFVRTGLAPGDRVAVVTTAMSQDAEFTADVPKLLDRIGKVTSQRRFSDEGAFECPQIRPYAAYLIVNHMDNQLLQAKVAELRACTGSRDPHPEVTVVGLSQLIWEHALFNSRNTLLSIEGLVKGMATLPPGQRMILLTSGGFYTGNLEMDEDLLMTKALHAEVVINTIDAKGLYTIIPGGDASEPRTTGRVPQRAQIANMQTQAREPEAKNDGLASLAYGTGGTFYHNSNDLADGFRKLGMVPDTIYVLSFAPSDGPADGRYHHLKVRLPQGRRYTLESRLGYTAPAPQSAAQAAAISRLDNEVMAADTLADLPAGFSWAQRDATPGITLVVRLDVTRLHFDIAEKRRSQKLTIVAVLTDSKGAFVTGKRSELEMSLTEETFARLAGTGANVAMTLLAPPGSYSARVVVQGGAEGKMAAAGAAVQIK